MAKPNPKQAEYQDNIRTVRKAKEAYDTVIAQRRDTVAEIERIESEIENAKATNDRLIDEHAEALANGEKAKTPKLTSLEPLQTALKIQTSTLEKLETRRTDRNDSFKAANEEVQKAQRGAAIERIELDGLPRGSEIRVNHLDDEMTVRDLKRWAVLRGIADGSARGIETLLTTALIFNTDDARAAERALVKQVKDELRGELALPAKAA